MIQQQLFSPIPQKIEHFPRFPLPQSYVDFLEKNGAGFFTKTKIQTTEPTRFGLDYALCNGVCGFTGGPHFPNILDAAWSPEVTGLPEYFVVFFQDGPVYYTFDYQNGAAKEPSIRLIDAEMDQWLEVANSFDEFLTKLEETTEAITYDMKDWISTHTLLQQIGQENPDTLEGLLEILQDIHPQLFLQQTAYALVHTESKAIRSIYKERFAFIEVFLSAEFSSYPEYHHCRTLLS